jgi:hypothetical protein
VRSFIFRVEEAKLVDCWESWVGWVEGLIRLIRLIGEMSYEVNNEEDI